MTEKNSFFSHTPVMLGEVIKHLSPKKGETYVDATFGGGGYTRAILESCPCRVIAIDRDVDAVQRAQTFKEQYKDRFDIVHAPFSHLEYALKTLNLPDVHGIVFDLGVSSYQIDDPHRGFSFRFDGPLSMAMGCNAIDAQEVINTYSEKELADIFFRGEEPFGRRIARAIVKKRTENPIETTQELASLIASCKPFSKDAQHPATLAFQALRIFVNDELTELKKALESCKNKLNSGGRLVVVTFHSLEDRIVKDFMRHESGGDPLPSRHAPLTATQLTTARFPVFKLPFKKALPPSSSEMSTNPRSRSAKLRCAIRTEHPLTNKEEG